MEATRLMARGDLIFNAEAQADETHTDVDESLAVWGLCAEAPDKPAVDPTFHLWPENVQAFAFWRGMQTQWRVGMAGPEGLDYAGVWALLANTVPYRQRKHLFADITHMEAGALTGYNELQRERDKQ